MNTRLNRRRFVGRFGLVSASLAVAPAAAGQSAQATAWAGAVLHEREGQVIPATPDGRRVTIKIDSQLTRGVRMSMIAEDLPPHTEIRMHLHRYEDEIILIRTGTGVATLGDREVPVAPGSTVYVPQGVWHGLRNNGAETLGMTAVYSPPGFEQAFKDRVLHPNRTQAGCDGRRCGVGIERPVSFATESHAIRKLAGLCQFFADGAMSRSPGDVWLSRCEPVPVRAPPALRVLETAGHASRSILRELTHSPSRLVCSRSTVICAGRDSIPAEHQYTKTTREDHLPGAGTVAGKVRDADYTSPWICTR
jgi:mannose-6-phosphate isomerase-like protein (cupin superfamily)